MHVTQSAAVLVVLGASLGGAGIVPVMGAEGLEVSQWCLLLNALLCFLVRALRAVE